MYKKLLLGLCLIVFAVNALPAQSWQQAQPWWYTLEQGKHYFRSGAYGEALLAFEDARRSRLAQFTRMEQDLILFLSVPEVRRVGDSLEFVEMFIDHRHETAAAAALAQLYHHIPKESLNGSVRRVLEELDRLKAYPEAEYWLGETFRAEGELALALQQYEKAFSDRSLLEVPGFDIEILYRITEIHRTRQNYQEMEKQAREIVEGMGPSGVPRDSLWVGNPPSYNPIRSAMARILETEGINRFLTLYRHDNTSTERAHRLLGFFYYATSRFSPAAEHLMFAFLIQNSILIEEVIRRNYDFSFSDLESLMVFVRTRPELRAFLEETEYYKTAFYLSSALHATGKSRPATQLWDFLSASVDAGEWGNRARRSPGPYIERAIEMP